MKATNKLFGMITFIVGVMLVFSLIGCDDGGGTGGGKPQTVTYTGVSGGKTYTLKITENTGRYVAQVGDTYLLSVDEDTSSGTVQTVNGDSITLTPTNAGTTPFVVTVAGTNLSTMVGTITWNDGGETVVNITSFTPVTAPGGDPVNPFEDEYPDAAFPALTGGNDFIGTWLSDEQGMPRYSIVLANNGTWNLRSIIGQMNTSVGNGRFLVSGNTAYFYWHETEDGPPYYYFNGYGTKTGDTLAMYGGFTYTGGSAWTKQP